MWTPFLARSGCAEAGDDKGVFRATPVCIVVVCCGLYLIPSALGL